MGGMPQSSQKGVCGFDYQLNEGCGAFIQGQKSFEGHKY